MFKIVADEAPRVFAVVQEYGDRAEVVGVDGGLTMSLTAPHDALWCFAWGSHITPRLVWVNPDAASSADDSEVA